MLESVFDFIMPPEKCYAATTDTVSNNNIDSAYSNDPLNLYTKKPWEIAPTIKLPDNESYIGPASKNAIPLQDDWQYDALNIQTAPIENKLQHFADFLNDRYLKPAKLYLTSIGSIAGMGKYSELYADFTIGSIFETGFTITGSGIKSASALIKGESISKDSIIAGSGAGNLKKIKSKKYVPKTGKWVSAEKTRSEWLNENNYIAKYATEKDQLRRRKGQSYSMDVFDINGNKVGRIDKNYRVNDKVVPEHYHLDSETENIHHCFNE